MVEVLSKQLQELLRRGQEHQNAEPPDLLLAEAAFREVIKLAPQWAEGHYSLGSVLALSERSEEACDAYESAINLDASDPRPHIALGRILSRVGKYNPAVDCLKKGIALKPPYGEADAYNMLAEAYERQNHIDKAIVLWHQVAAMKPTYPSYDLPIQEALDKLRIHASGVADETT